MLAWPPAWDDVVVIVPHSVNRIVAEADCSFAFSLGTMKRGQRTFMVYGTGAYNPDRINPGSLWGAANAAKQGSN